MRVAARFACPSVSLALSALLRKSTGVLWVCLGLGVAMHLSFTAVRGLEAEEKVSKPLTTQFVKRQPRLTKPLELKKRPQPRRRRVERTMVAVEARLERGKVEARFQPVQVLKGLARPRAEIGRVTGGTGLQREPEVLAGVIGEAKEPEDKIDLGLELLDIEALDTGRYHAMVIQDPTDKRNITGFLNLAYVYSNEMEGLGGVVRSADMTFYGVTRLVDRVNEWTQINTRIAGRYTFDSPELFKTPWVYTRAGHSNATWVTPRSESENLGRYLQQGGFWIADGLQGGPGVGQDIPMRNAVKDACAAVDHKYGRDWDFEVLGFDHLIFHCFFEFPDGAPVSADNLAWGGPRVNFPVEGVFWGERLVVLYTNKNLVHGWVGRSPAYPQYDVDGTRVFQFGVNTIVFALTQEGSITRRLMDSVQ